jgi:predicted RNA-binding Zn-ribbon protein involved in translation (DUF1610 family)
MAGVQPATMDSNAIVRDACPKCGTAMLLSRIAPDQPRHHLRIFECPKCKQLKTKIVKYC